MTGLPKKKKKEIVIHRSISGRIVELFYYALEYFTPKIKDLIAMMSYQLIVLTDNKK